VLATAGPAFGDQAFVNRWATFIWRRTATKRPANCGTPQAS